MPRLLVACPACATPIEKLTIAERNASVQVFMLGGHTCSGCGKRWQISVTARWADPAPPAHAEDDVGSGLTVYRYTSPAHFSMACFRCELDLERITLEQTTPPIRIEADGERTCPSCGKHWHIAYTASWDE
jgi:uncharacterized protein with PIN domain